MTDFSSSTGRTEALAKALEEIAKQPANSDLSQKVLGMLVRDNRDNLLQAASALRGAAHAAPERPRTYEETKQIYRELISETRAQLTQCGDKGEAVAWAVFAANGNIRMWSTINADVEGFAKQIGAVVTPLYAAPQPASNAYALPSRDQVASAVRLVLNEGIWPEYQTQDDNGLAGPEYVDFIFDVFSRITSALPSTPQKSPCSHAAIIGLDGMWHCQKCGDAIDVAVAHSSTDGKSP